MVLQGKIGLGPTGRLGTGRVGYHGGIFWVHTCLAMSGEAGCSPVGEQRRGALTLTGETIGCMRPGCQPSALQGNFPWLALSSLEPPHFMLG